MDKRVFLKIIRECMLNNHFVAFKNRRDYFFDCNDGITRLIVRVPDMTRGFLLSAQFRDFGAFTGNFHDSLMSQYDFENTLAFASSREYEECQIRMETQKVISGIADYMERGKTAIKEKVTEWMFGAFDEKVKNDVLVYLGFEGIDPYSIQYLLDKVNFMKHGGVSVIPLSEYEDHMDFYHQYSAYGCTLDVDECDRKVRISYNR